MNLKPPRILTALLALAILLSACTSEPADNETEILGEINYQAEVAWLENIRTDSEELLEYREVLDLDRFVSQSEVPVVIIVRQENDYGASEVIPLVEEAAYTYGEDVHFVFAYHNTENDFLLYLDYESTPTFFLIHDHAVQAQAGWEQEEGLIRLQKKLDEIIKEG